MPCTRSTVQFWRVMLSVSRSPSALEAPSAADSVRTHPIRWMNAANGSAKMLRASHRRRHEIGRSGRSCFESLLDDPVLYYEDLNSEQLSLFRAAAWFLAAASP